MKKIFLFTVIAFLTFFSFAETNKTDQKMNIQFEVPDSLIGLSVDNVKKSNIVWIDFDSEIVYSEKDLSKLIKQDPAANRMMVSSNIFNGIAAGLSIVGLTLQCMSYGFENNQKARNAFTSLSSICLISSFIPLYYGLKNYYRAIGIYNHNRLQEEKR